MQRWKEKRPEARAHSYRNIQILVAGLAKDASGRQTSLCRDVFGVLGAALPHRPYQKMSAPIKSTFTVGTESEQVEV